jgi:tungstate transport system substrate-binding protein
MNSSNKIGRRPLVLAGALAVLVADEARSAQKQSLEDPMRLGVDEALMKSGLARALQRAFGADTGVVVHLTSGPALSILEAVELGDMDAALTNVSWLETHIEKQGLVHDRRPIATGSLLLVGPAALAKALDAKRDIVLALQRLSQAQVPFISGSPGCGSQLAEQTLWRAAEVVPDPAWHFTSSADAAMLTQAKDKQACLLVEAGAWMAQGGGGSGYAVLVEADDKLAMPVHVMRSFRVNHPAGKLFVNWIAGRRGRRVVAAQRGYRSV